MAVADGLLPAGVLADLFYGQVNFDQAFGVLGHVNSAIVEALKGI